MRRMSCRPSPVPSRGSTRTRSGALRAATSSASSALPALATGTRPGSPRSSAKRPARTAGWGSTMATRVTHRTFPAEGKDTLNFARGYREMDVGTDSDAGPRARAPDQALRRRPARARRGRPDRPRRRVLRAARAQRRRQDDADLGRLQPDPDHLGRGARVRPRARDQPGAADDRARRAGHQPRPLPRRGGDARLPRRLLRHEPRRRPPPGERDDRRLRPAREGGGARAQALGRHAAAAAARPRAHARAAPGHPRRADGRRRLRAAARALALHPPTARRGHDDPPHHALPRGGGGAVRGDRADPRRPADRPRLGRRAARCLRRRLARRRLRQGDGRSRRTIPHVKLTIVGGGGFRVPLVYGALLARRDRLPFDEVVLHDVDAGRMDRMGHVLDGLAAERGAALPFRATTDLGEAVDGADFVFCAIRVGQLEGRVVDEAVPLELGVLGQETTGPGGICFALRTIPEMVRLAETVAERAPGAWVVNFTNPAGMVTEALQTVLGDRAVGICDSPSALCRRVARAVGREPEEMWFDYFGLNHLGWLRAAHDADRDRLPELLADDDALGAFEEGRLFGAEWLRTLGMIPNEYLFFHYFSSDTVGAIRSGLESRGEFLLHQQASFYDTNGRTPDEALEAWRATRREREANYFAEAHAAAGLPAETEWEDVGGYEGQAIAVVEAIAFNRRSVLITNTANRSSMPFLDERAVVEVPCLVGSAGIVPAAVGDVPDHARALIEAIKAVERTTIQAALTGSRDLAVKALALHPLVPSVNTARRIFDAYAGRQRELAALFS